MPERERVVFCACVCVCQLVSFVAITSPARRTRSFLFSSLGKMDALKADGKTLSAIRVYSDGWWHPFQSYRAIVMSGLHFLAQVLLLPQHFEARISCVTFRLHSCLLFILFLPASHPIRKL